MQLLDNIIHKGVKYRVMTMRQPTRYETGRTYELLRYGVGLDKAYAGDWLVLHESEFLGDAEAARLGGMSSVVQSGRTQGSALIKPVPDAVGSNPSSLAPATIIDWPFGVVRG